MNGKVARKLRKQVDFYPQDSRNLNKNNYGVIENNPNSPRAKYQKLKKRHKNGRR